MVRIASSIDIHRPPAEVFEFITAASNDSEWQYGTLGSGQISAGAAGLGGSFRTVGHLMGRRVVSTFEVTEYDPHRKYGIRSMSGPLASHTLYTLEGTTRKTRVSVETLAIPQDISAPPRTGMERDMQRQLKDNLVMLKTVLEAPVSAAVTA
jgi:hypothetical protein